MSEHFQESEYPRFTAAVQANMAAQTAPTDAIELRIGGAEASVRLRGAFLTRLALRDGQGQQHEVLYADADSGMPKLPASHVMMPVCGYDGAGGQHGFARWVDYRDNAPDVSRHARRFAGLQAEMLDLPLELRRSVALHSTRASLLTHVHNQGKKLIQTSVGEHLYFTLPDGATAGDVSIKNGTIDNLTHRGAAAEIADGQAAFWPGYEGRPVRVDIPGGPSFTLDTAVHGPSAQPEDVGLLLWQRPGKPFICIEPTVGYRHGQEPPANRGALIPAHGGVLAVTTTIDMR